MNGKPFSINALYIEIVECFPDTTITLTNGKKYVVKENEEEIMERIHAFYQSVNLLGLDRKEALRDEGE